MHDDLAVGLRHLHAEAAGDLIAHAGEAVFEMVGGGRARLPELVQFAGQAARAQQQRNVAAECALHRADHLRVGGQRIGRGGDRVGLLHPRLEAVLRMGGPRAGAL